MIFIYSLIRLDHLKGYKKPPKWPAATWLISSIVRVLHRYRIASCPFRKRSLPFLRHLENFFHLLLSVPIKKEENRNPRSNVYLEPEPFVS